MQLLKEFVTAVGLSDGDREHLISHRQLKPRFIEGRFASADAECVQQALEHLLGSGYTAKNLQDAHLVDEKGRPLAYLVAGGVLIVYTDEDSEPFYLRAHKLGPEGVPSQIYGRECLAKRPRQVVITEGEYKSAALLSAGVPAIAVPGVSSFTGGKYEDLLHVLRASQVKEAVVSFDSENRIDELLPSGERNEHYKADPSIRYDTQLNAIILARRLSGDGIPAKIAALPDGWRDAQGKADIDGVLRQGHTIKDLKDVFKAAVAPETYLTTLSDEAQRVIRRRLCEGEARRQHDGWHIRDGGIDLQATKVERSKRVRLVVSDNYRPVFNDTIDIGSTKSRDTFIKAAGKELSEEVVTVVKQLLKGLSLAIANAKEGSKELPVDGELLHIGSREVVLKSDGIYLRHNSQEEQVSNFVLTITEDRRIEDGIETKRELWGRVAMAGGRHGVQLPATALAAPLELSKLLLDQVGHGINFYGGHVGQEIVAEVAREHGRPLKQVVKRTFGWDDRGRYLTPTGCFDGNGPIRGADIAVSLEGERVAHRLGLRYIDDAQLRDLAEHILTDYINQHDREVTLPVLGHTFAAPIIDMLGPLGWPALILRGDSGARKTTVAQGAQCFYGKFIGEKPFELWRSTVNSIQRTGYFFKDALFLVDDYKLANVTDIKGSQSLIQTYADRGARGRLTRSSTGHAPAYDIRGLLLITGEDLPSREASVAARMIVVEVPKRDEPKYLEPGQRCRNRCAEYSGFMGRFVSWVAGQTERLSSDHSAIMQWFHPSLAGAPNGPRITSNLAINALGFGLFLEFAEDHKLISAARSSELFYEHEQILKHMAITMAGLVQEQGAVERFLSTLQDVLDSGEHGLVNPAAPSQERPRRVLGFDEGGDMVEIFGGVAYAAVEELLRKQGTSLGLSKNVLGRELRRKGIVEGESEQLRLSEAEFLPSEDRDRQRKWKIKREILGLAYPKSQRPRLEGVPRPRSDHSDAGPV